MMEKNAKEYSGSPILEPFHGMLILNPEMREKVMLICNSAKIQVSILILKKASSLTIFEKDYRIIFLERSLPTIYLEPSGGNDIACRLTRSFHT